jgi:Cohesin domain/Bacterial Ig-like domain
MFVMNKFLIVLLLTLAVLPGSVFAATLAVTPATGVYNAGATFTARVVVNTAGKSINAAEGTVKFNPSELTVVSVDRSGSIFNLWVTEPTFSNSAGTISFSGGLPSGYTGGSGSVFSITFRAKAAGAPKVTLTGGSVLANDGMGTNVLTNMSGGTYTVQAPSTTPAPEVVIEYVAPANTPAAPQITSTTHAGGDSWSKNKTAKLAWNLPAGIEAVRTLLDGSATAIPTKVYESPISNIELIDLAEGVSFFHLQFKNADGWGKVTHYRLAVDTEAPSEFVVTTAEGTESANPVQTLALKVTDTASGIARYMVRIDNDEAFEYVDKDKTGKLTLPALTPGYHSVIIEAFDGASNSVIATHSFNIESFSKPEFTEYPTEINEEVIPVLRGTTRAGAQVAVSIEKIGAEPITYQMTADEKGVFTVIPSGTFQSGVYEITAKATDTYGAQSEVSDPIRIAVQQPGYLKVGSFIVSILSIIIPLLAMTVLLVGFAWFMVIYYRRFKNKVTTESGEVVLVLTQEFDSLRANLLSKKDALASSRKTGKLTKLEEITFAEMEEAITVARKRITKEVDDVEQALHKKPK